MRSSEYRAQINFAGSDLLIEFDKELAPSFGRLVSTCPAAGAGAREELIEVRFASSTVLGVVPVERGFQVKAPRCSFSELRLWLGALVAARHDDGMLLHAAAVEIEGRCVVLAGRSGAGKTTLAALADVVYEDDAVCLVNGTVQFLGQGHATDVVAGKKRIRSTGRSEGRRITCVYFLTGEFAPDAHLEIRPPGILSDLAACDPRFPLPALRLINRREQRLGSCLAGIDLIRVNPSTDPARTLQEIRAHVTRSVRSVT